MVPITECSIWGRASCPWDPVRVPGGSSGGEGVLVGEYGSVIGIGTDIGGSVRIPASWSGLTAYKSTPQRTTTLGMDKAKIGDNKYTGNKVRTVAGPMTRSVDDCVTLLKCWWCKPAYAADPYVPQLPFNDSIYQQHKPLRIGYFLTDHNLMESCVSVKRGITETIHILQQLGHDVVPFKSPSCTPSLIRLWQQFFAGTGAISQITALHGESPLHHYTHLTKLFQSSHCTHITTNIY